MKFGLINIYGALIIVLVLLPNIIYAVKNKNVENKCKNKFIEIAEQIGRYASMVFMILPVGVQNFEFSFSSKEKLTLWLAVCTALIAVYYAAWIVYFRKIHLSTAIVLAMVPSLIFIFSGIFLVHPLLIISGIVFAVPHIYVTYVNNK